MAAVTYKNAGVNIDAADAFIAKIKPLVRSTSRPEVLGGIGGFSGLFRPHLRAEALLAMQQARRIAEAAATVHAAGREHGRRRHQAHDRRPPAPL